jgi:hypothetical protein
MYICKFIKTNMSESFPSPQQVIDYNTDVLHRRAGSFVADIFSTASSMFPSFKERFANVDMQFSEEPGFSYRGRSDLVESIIEVGPASAEMVTRFAPQRIEKRFGVDASVIQTPELGPELLRFIGFAHELGHLVQDDSAQMLHFFGETIPDATEGDVVAELDSPQKYADYVNRESEINADYIGRSILANTQIGAMLGIELPEQEPKDWRQWAQDHMLQAEEL